MTRSIRAAAAVAILAGGIGSAGCACRNCGTCGAGGGLEDRYRNAWDEAWPERYNYAARESVLAPFAQQVATGHFLEQTIWNWYFVSGTDILTPGGIEKLNSLNRETPGPDPRLYIQTARDIIVTPDNVPKLAALQDELNARRAAAIKRYMAQQPGLPVAYEVYVHDAPVPGIYAPFAIASFNGQKIGYRGGINAGASGGGTGGGAAGQAQAPVATTTVNNAAPSTPGTGTPGAAPGSPTSGAPGGTGPGTTGPGTGAIP
jgi:hypothetical protein